MKMAGLMVLGCLVVVASSSPAQEQGRGARSQAGASVATPRPALMEERALQKDAVRLRDLTVELRSMLATSNGGTLPAAAVKKAQEVEKLAKSLKEKMEKQK